MFLAVLTSYAGAQLFGESYGSGTPGVLALHGWRRDHQDFAATLTRPDPLDAIAIDLPGFGGTPLPEQVWGSPRYAEALVPLLEEMQSRVVVVGHSFGGRVAVHLAALAPERVAGLVLTGVPLYRASDAPSRSPLRFRVLKTLAKAGRLSDERLEQNRQRYGSADYRAASGVLRDIFVTLVAEDYRAAVAQVRCPVELVWGEDDREVPLVVASKIQAGLPGGAHLVVCEGAGHMTPLTVPGELRAAVERLLP